MFPILTCLPSSRLCLWNWHSLRGPHGLCCPRCHIHFLNAGLLSFPTVDSMCFCPHPATSEGQKPAENLSAIFRASWNLWVKPDSQQNWSHVHFFFPTICPYVILFFIFFSPWLFHSETRELASIPLRRSESKTGLVFNSDAWCTSRNSQQTMVSS